MPATKIVNEQEVIRWFEEGRTYKWMTDEYRRKYNTEMVSSAWGNFRRRRGLARRINRDDDLIPWHVLPKHRWSYQLQMLRAEARRRAGFELRDEDQRRLPAWLRHLEEEDVVIDYVPELEEGFVFTPREPDDDDIIRRPRRKTTLRKAAD